MDRADVVSKVMRRQFAMGEFVRRSVHHLPRHREIFDRAVAVRERPPLRLAFLGRHGRESTGLVEQPLKLGIDRREFLEKSFAHFDTPCSLNHFSNALLHNTAGDRDSRNF